jgi:hypothetical protein
MIAWILALTLTLVLSSSTLAQNNIQQECTLAAAQRLPKIPGLVIVSRRVKPMPEDLQKDWQLQRDRYKGFVSAQGPSKKDLPISALVVEIESRAAAQDVTFSFVCFSASGLPAVIHAMTSRPYPRTD